MFHLKYYTLVQKRKRIVKILASWQFIFLVIFVSALQLFLLRIILDNGFTADDWMMLFDYKTISPGLDFLDKVYRVFQIKGIYTTYQVIYIGLLESIFKGNYQAYQITNIILKTLATLSLYPLILIVFKRKSLAFLTTILYATSYSSSGALQFVVKGSDYLAIIFMNICLVTYYLSFKKESKLLLLLTSILLFFSFIFSPIRIYPLLLFIVVIELIILIISHSWSAFIFRLFLLIYPLVMILQYGPKSTSFYLDSTVTVFKIVSSGNYQLLLTPFAGLGYTFLPNDILSIFGNVSFDGLEKFLKFLIKGPFVIYIFLSIIIAFLITKKPIKLTVKLLLINIAFQLLTFLIITNSRINVNPYPKGFAEISTNAILLGFFIVSIAISSLMIWFKNNRSNNMLFSIFAGPVFSSIFLWGTWLIIGDNLTFKEGIHWYLIIPPIGSSLFLASLMVIGFDKTKGIINPYLKYTLTACLLLILLPIYLVSAKEINSTFNNLLHIGYGASDQEKIKAGLLSQIKEPLDKNKILFYLDTSDLNESPYYYPVTIISGFGEKMHFRNWEIINGCVGLVYDKVTLEKSIVEKSGLRGFNIASLCVNNYSAVERPVTFYTKDNFYAFKFKDRQVIDIRNEMLKESGLW